MPRRVTTEHDTDGALLRVELVRRADAEVGITIEIVETDSRNGVPESSRTRVFTNNELTVLQRTNLTTLFDQIEARIKTQRYT